MVGAPAGMRAEEQTATMQRGPTVALPNNAQAILLQAMVQMREALQNAGPLQTMEMRENYAAMEAA
eukprot:4671938-Prorocentrum_lima.AAC.1